MDTGPRETLGNQLVGTPEHRDLPPSGLTQENKTTELSRVVAFWGGGFGVGMGSGLFLSSPFLFSLAWLPTHPNSAPSQDLLPSLCNQPIRFEESALCMLVFFQEMLACDVCASSGNLLPPPTPGIRTWDPIKEMRKE